MYRYDPLDQRLVDERVEQFRDQVARRMAGEITEDEFKPLRLMNGLYIQLHAYMLRIAIPYGMLSSTQLRKLAHIARTYDRGYGHFTTRQCIQFNWPKLEDTPEILAELAEVQMHAIQTSGNSFRNVTADQYAGVSADEIDDSRPYAEIIRQWGALHPEFSYLPRKFKIAVTGSPNDRTAAKFHDIGVILKKNDAVETGFEIIIGGGQGRTPMIAQTVREFLPRHDLLSYLEAIMRIYNLMGRRDNIFKAKLKILVYKLGIDEMQKLVEEEWNQIKDGPLKLPQAEIDRVAAHFAPPPFETVESDPRAFDIHKFESLAFARWARTNVAAHKQPGYAIVNLTLKPTGGVPGDATAEQMDAVADLADRYSLGEIRVTHEQNLVFAHVKEADLYRLWRALDEIGFATPNLSLIGDMICCPGLDYCGLANARSIPVAQRIGKRFADLDRQLDIGELRLKISGCINACGHHHVGHVGILGVERKGEEYYQITLGGNPAMDATIGDVVGPAFSSDDVVDAVETVVTTYVKLRADGERFLDTYHRVGAEPFKERLYPEKTDAAA
ncbi:MAG TPA: nitrite/sulfite reductase [Rhodospirillales bacterium]|jgi:sulfite reductase (NADPH) hemoprotein beta-component|nr:nitrite/sulfite reductase [Rhodospirillales bacterium]